METILKAKSLFLVMTALFLFIPLFLAAVPYSVEVRDNIKLSQEVSDRYNNIISQHEVIWAHAARVNVEALLKADTLSFLLDNNHVVLYAQYHHFNHSYSYVYYESADKNEQATVSIYKDNIQIDLRTSFGKYYITSISETEVAIVKYESDIPAEPEYEEIYYDDKLHSSEPMEVESVVPDTTPVIRVLFLYTSSALAMMSYPQETALKNEVYLYINDGNRSFDNSGINAHLEVAYIGHVSYNESSHTWSQSLNYFCNNNDGVMDEVHTLRDKYAADICMLMLNDSTHCGEAKTIKANSNTAFSIIWPKHIKCGWRYSPIHEIGHLIGCRHNIAEDNSNNPYKYGHGFMHCDTITPYTSWCTIMSYESSCYATTRRILNWSNPNIYHNGIATGSTTYENNARVWNERASTVSAFRTEDNNISLTVYDNNASALYESYIATNIITTGAGYEVQSGQTVDMAAAAQIKLMPNTHIKYGSVFRASIRGNADNHTYPQFIKSSQTDNTGIQKESSFSISPNPVHDILTINSTEILENIAIYNLAGQCVLQTKQTEINVSELPNGIYLLRAITTAGEQRQAKFIKQ